MRGCVLALLIAGCAARGPAGPEPAAPLPPPSWSARASFLQAVVAEERGEVEAAEQALEWVVRRDPARPEAHAWLARFFQRQRRWDEAAATWRAVLSLDPDHAEAHAALATLLGRAGDAEGERTHLEAAVAAGAPPEVHERLFDLHLDRGAPAQARVALDAWRQLHLDGPLEHLHRARAARRLDAHDLAVEDLVHTRFGGLLYESAQASCRWGSAWRWAQQTDPEDPLTRVVVADIAERVGDAALLERTLLPGEADPPPVSDLPPWPAPPLPAASHAEDEVRVAEAWRRAGRPGRALQILDAVPQAHRDPVVLLARSRALLDQGRPEVAGAVAARVDGPGLWRGHAVLLQLAAGTLDPSAALEALGEDPEAARGFVDAAIDREVAGGPTEVIATEGVPWTVRDGRVVLPPGVADPWVESRVILAFLAARERGDAPAVESVARTWLDLDPQAAVPRYALGRLGAEGRDALDAILEPPCSADALLIVAEHAHDDSTTAWWVREAWEAEPLRAVVQRAVVHHGLRDR